LRRYEEGEEKNQNCPILGDQKKPQAKTQWHCWTKKKAEEDTTFCFNKRWHLLLPLFLSNEPATGYAKQEG
jgi:hypothetical protein